MGPCGAGAGDILLAEDFTGQGHCNRVLDDQSLVVAFVRIDEDVELDAGRREERRDKV